MYAEVSIRASFDSEHVRGTRVPVQETLDISPIAERLEAAEPPLFPAPLPALQNRRSSYHCDVSEPCHYYLVYSITHKYTGLTADHIYSCKDCDKVDIPGGSTV